ncbi:hypothetical protein V6Z11_D06G174600 [Gossypium hirsutum]
MGFRPWPPPRRRRVRWQVLRRGRFFSPFQTPFGGRAFLARMPRGRTLHPAFRADFSDGEVFVDTTERRPDELCPCSLGPWQFNKYNKRKHQINKLSKKLDDIIDAPNAQANLNSIKETRLKLKKLYEEDEIYWAQRSRIGWLKESDGNTKFFHMRATSRRKKNDIDRLKDSSGGWVYNNRDKCRVARDYFIDLFQTSTNIVNNMDMSCIPKCVNEEMNKNLTKSFTDEEILRAFNQINPRKAPGSDGLPGIFFKENWEVVGKDILSCCHDFLNAVVDMSSINETIIVLIPKINEPD